MNTVNIVLMIVLTAIISFSAGNAYGQQKMRMIVSGMLDKAMGLIRKAGENTTGGQKDE